MGVPDHYSVCRMTREAPNRRRARPELRVCQPTAKQCNHTDRNTQRRPSLRDGSRERERERERERGRQGEREIEHREEEKGDESGHMHGRVQSRGFGFGSKVVRETGTWE